MTKPEIQPTQQADIAGLQVVLDQTGLFPSDMLPDMLAPALAREAEAFWLTCHIGDAAVGFCYTAPEELTVGTWNMLALAVRPDFQGQGLGGALVKAAEKHLADMGQRILIVETSGTDAFALTRKFYAENGYDEEGRICDFWAEGDDKVVFRKTL
ncbi:GNAT family N-acetyltransferase [Pseudaestuariivita rosea]|uniref:GNAT family N-acetyltransferase n=1 Tax=Pseudaestuariivita rosea TaxID=2763263 RepID=UPI001ABB45CF|nr:GNAT family N-acetyltransferase [Pseudaestuariivita rosea]